MDNTSRKLPRLQCPPTFLVVLASIASAVVVTACGPESDGPTTLASTSSVTLPAARAYTEAQPDARFIEVADHQRPAASSHFGEVRSIEPIRSAPKATGAGAAIGGVAGGVLGHQFGSGSGNTVATVAGAVGGAVAGHQVEKHRSEKVVGYRVRVRLETGATRTIRMPSLDGLRVGDRVRVNGDRQLQRV